MHPVMIFCKLLFRLQTDGSNQVVRNNGKVCGSHARANKVFLIRWAPPPCTQARCLARKK